MSDTLTVSSLAELHTALANAQGGETILLEGGNYGDLYIGAKSGYDVTFPDNVTIASADPSNPATFSGLDVRDAANLTFDGILFDYTFEAGDPIWLRPFSVTDSDNITIRNSTFDGDLAQGVSDIADGYGYGIGLSLKGTTGATIENNEIFNFHRGLTVTESGDVTVRGNDVHSIRSDGMDFSEITGALIEDNYLHDFRGSLESGDHRDMIQFWTKGTDAPSTDITIRGNTLDIGEGDATQSIFMRNDQVDQGLAGSEMFYSNILIEDNVIVNGHMHGITVGETNGLVIRGNSVLHADGGAVDGLDESYEIPKINVAPTSTGVLIQSNATAEITGWSDQSDWMVDNNGFVQDQDSAADGFYGDVFLNSSLTAVDGVHDFRALSDSLLVLDGIGAAATLEMPTSAEASADFNVDGSEDNATLYHFDGTFSSADLGNLPEGTEFLWDFGDGLTASGAEIDHAFLAGGSYTVSLTIELPDGRTDTSSVVVEVQGSGVLTYVQGTGFIAYDNGVEVVLGSVADDTSAALALAGDLSLGLADAGGLILADADVDADAEAEGLKLGATGVAVSVARENVSALLGEDEFRISMSLTADGAESAGEVVRLHGSFIATVTAKGELQLKVFTTDGTQIRLTTSGADLIDTATHDIDISLEDGVLAIMVDGTVLAETEMSGTLASTGNQDLSFGNAWGKDNFAGTLSAFEITVNEDDFAAANLASVMAANLESVDTLDGLQLGATGVAVSVARENVSDLLGQDDFSISMSLTADGAESAGEVVRLHGSFIATVTAKGELQLKVFTTDGTQIRLTTSGADLADTATHDIDISLKDGVLAIMVDGTVLAETEMSGTLASSGKLDMTFGNAWGKDNFAGTLSAFEITVNEDDLATANLDSIMAAEEERLAVEAVTVDAESDAFIFVSTDTSDLVLGDTTETLYAADDLLISSDVDVASVEMADSSLALLESQMVLTLVDAAYDTL
ncbi:right-handed parallel beta-helix repeat-containing protein [Puniceibacterium sediminis]|uniref:Parallel beta-helix repeat (Two copies) n=1 Tax=Puniceibacterium sediminis TaxID=1608407 RepID=A0A238YKZ9_9RHOB|nr:right-handed parallel beta-helix repeat-containing protein [Puniceibacterium sediminis]SNR71926.1 parallel beta-helix repeat (two copies) [Puniceibacterium sediminis]